ncbi:hypothetical protein Ancab_013737 [Ancistrocladus abbreviatus]
MADGTKYQLISNGNLFTDFKAHFSPLISRRSKLFVYGILFIFVASTVLFAFFPSYSSSSPWFMNIFTTSTDSSHSTAFPSSSSSTTSSSIFSDESYRSHFSSIFSYFFPNSSFPSQSNSFRSQNPTASQKPTSNSSLPLVKNETKTEVVNAKSEAFRPNQTVNYTISNNRAANSTLDLGFSEKEKSGQARTVVNVTADSPSGSGFSEKKNSGQEGKVVNGTVNSTAGSGFSEKNSIGQEGNFVKEKEVAANYTASLSRKQSNQRYKTVPDTPPPPPPLRPADVNKTDAGGKPAPERKEEDLISSLVNCDLYDGEWVRDDSYPLYKPGSCSLIDEQFNCFLNGRPDSDYQKLKWKPKGCILPRLNGSHMLDLLRGKRLVFVGDSLNRNMWESLVCILRNSVKDQSKVYEASGRVYFRTEAYYSFVFEDYSCTVEFYASPFLVRQWEVKDKNGTVKETLRLDLIGESSDQVKNADVIVFNTGHWWTHEKTSLGKDYYQEGSHVYSDLNVVEAFRRALTTWARWVDANVNSRSTHVLFRGYSASHFSGGQWNSGGQCNSETQPIKNETYLNGYPWKMQVFEKVIRGIKTHVSYLNVTRMTDYRKDGHPSIYRKQHLSKEERKSPLRYQDCSHWCLPGVPDTWNELLYAELLRKQYKNQHQQQKT